MNLEKLILESAKENLSAQAELFGRFSGPLSTICKRFIKNAEDAEEAMMEGFAHFFDLLIEDFTFESDAKTFAFLKQLVIQKCIRHLRGGLMVAVVPVDEAEDIPMNEDGLDKLSMDEIMRMIDKLPDGYRTVLNLHCFEGLKHEQIAEMLNITVASSRSQLYKARNYLNKLLIDKGYNHGKARPTE